jgi:hypothetical protein
MAKPIQPPFSKNSAFDNLVKAVKNHGLPGFAGHGRGHPAQQMPSWPTQRILSSSKTLYWSK